MRNLRDQDALPSLATPRSSRRLASPTVRRMSQEPKDRMTEADLRRSRLMCHIAAAVFAGCGLLFLATSLSLPVRAVVGGFNFVIAVAVVLYAQTLRAENPKE